MAVIERITGWTRRPLRPAQLLTMHPALSAGAPLLAWDASDGWVDSAGRTFTPVGTVSQREATEGPETVASGSGNRLDAPANFSPPTAACTVILGVRAQTSAFLFQSHTGSNFFGIRATINASNQLEFAFGEGLGSGPSNRRTYVVTAALTPGQHYNIVISFRSVTSGYIAVDGASAAFTVTGTATSYQPGTGLGMLHAVYQAGAYFYGAGAGGLTNLTVLPYYTEQDLGESLGRNPWQLYARREEHVYNFSGVPEITSLTPADTSVAVQWSGLADQYRINNGTATSLPDGISPDTITGLTVNTEYNAPGLQLRYLGGAWSAAVAFGTTNPGSGGGELPSGPVMYGAAGLSGVSSAGTIEPAVGSELTGAALFSGVASSGAITSSAPSTLAGPANLGGFATSGVIQSLAPFAMTGAAVIGGLSMSGGFTGVVTNTLALPRLAFRQKTGELFPLLLDESNVPYAYTRPNGAVVNIRPLDTVSLGVAVNEGTGEMLIII